MCITDSIEALFCIVVVVLLVSLTPVTIHGWQVVSRLLPLQHQVHLFQTTQKNTTDLH